MSTTLVTGVAGFIGSHVAEHLIRGGHRVVGVDDLSGGFIENIPPGVEFHQGCILDDAVISRIFRQERIDYVFHLAAYAAEGLSHFIRAFNYSNNLIGSMKLINASVNGHVKCFVFTSSIAVYGAAQVPMREDMTPSPEDPYGIAKYAVEMDLRAAHSAFGLNYVIFRPHNVYGERQNLADRYRNVIGIFMRQVLSGEPMTVFGDGEQLRAFSYIDDVAPTIARSIDLPEAYGQVFNIGSSTPRTVNNVALTVAKAAGVRPEVRHLAARHEVVNAYPEHNKTEAVFGATQTIGLEEGIERMWRWAQTIQVSPPKAFTDIEIPKHLPPSWTAYITPPEAQPG